MAWQKKQGVWQAQPSEVNTIFAPVFLKLNHSNKSLICIGSM